MKGLNKLRKNVAKFYDRLAENGWKFALWACTVCGKDNLHNVPKKSDIPSGRTCWDSMTTCVHCGGMSFVLYFPSGRTISRSFEKMQKEIVRREKPMSLKKARELAKI